MLKNENQLLDELGDARKEQDRLFHALQMSVQIQQLWPEAFQFGSVTASLHGPFVSERLHELQLRVRRGDVDERYFPIAEVPKELRDFHIDRHLEKSRGHVRWTRSDEYRLRMAREEWDSE